MARSQSPLRALTRENTAVTSEHATRSPDSRTEQAGATTVIGTRSSPLAMWQTTWVLDHLRPLAPAHRWQIREVTTRGDQTQALNIPLTQLGDKSMFVAELERALLARAVDVAVQPLNDLALIQAEASRPADAAEVDVAVHSLKDLPGRLTPGLALAAVPTRADPRDALVSRNGHTLTTLPHGATVATGSLRRRAQLLHLRPDLRIVNIRGNVDTRLRKTLAVDGPDATVLAAAGLQRLGLEGHITEYLPTDVLVPAVGQGALAVETRATDRETRRLVRLLDDPATRQAVAAERAVLATLGGGCQVPLGAHATAQPGGTTLRLVAVVASLDGRRLVRIEETGDMRRPVALGRSVARALLRQGGKEILAAILRGGASVE